MRHCAQHFQSVCKQQHPAPWLFTLPRRHTPGRRLFFSRFKVTPEWCSNSSDTGRQTHSLDKYNPAYYLYLLCHSRYLPTGYEHGSFACLQASLSMGPASPTPTLTANPSVWSKSRGRSRLWTRSCTVSPCTLTSLVLFYHFWNANALAWHHTKLQSDSSWIVSFCCHRTRSKSSLLN